MTQDTTADEIDATPARDEHGRLVVDALGKPCPQPVIELAAAIRIVEVDAEVLLLADDEAADVDVPVWCRMQRHELVERTEDGATRRFVVAKRRES